MTTNETTTTPDPESDPGALIRITLTEAENLWHTSCSAALFPSDRLYPVEGRTPVEVTSGNLVWCQSYIEALMLAKVHLAYGYAAQLLIDIDNSSSWVVHTTLERIVGGTPKTTV